MTTIGLVGVCVLVGRQLMSGWSFDLMPHLYWLLGRIGSLVISLAILSLCLMPILNEKGREQLGKIWISGFKVVFELCRLVVVAVIAVLTAAIRYLKSRNI